MIDVSQHLAPADPSDSRWVDIGLHGTKRMHVDAILRNGLFAGGDRGRKARAHIHIVSGLDATGKRAGVRDGSDTVIRIDTNRYYRDGGKCWWSVNDVLLTEGMWENGRDIGIPPQYLLGAFNRSTGEEIHPLLTPDTDQQGRVPGAKIVAESVISSAEAERMMQSIAYNREEVQADLDHLQEQTEAQESIRAVLDTPLGSPRPRVTSLEPSAGAGSSSSTGVWDQPMTRNVRDPEAWPLPTPKLSNAPSPKSVFVNSVLEFARPEDGTMQASGYACDDGEQTKRHFIVACLGRF